jgi:hypothetical protein
MDVQYFQDFQDFRDFQDFQNFRKFPEIFRKRRGFPRDFGGKIRGFFRVFRL